MKKITLGLTLCMINLLAFFIVGGVAHAYLSDQAAKKNMVTVGTNVVEVSENFNQIDNWIPGETYIKQVKVKNIGTVPCYVRVLIVSSNDDFVETLHFASNYTNNWQKNGDYYYYKKVLQPNETTTNLLESVTMANISSDFQEPFEIYVYAESVQSEGYSGAVQAFSDIK